MLSFSPAAPTFLGNPDGLTRPTSTTPGTHSDLPEATADPVGPAVCRAAPTSRSIRPTNRCRAGVRLDAGHRQMPPVLPEKVKSRLPPEMLAETVPWFGRETCLQESGGGAGIDSSLSCPGCSQPAPVTSRNETVLPTVRFLLPIDKKRARLAPPKPGGARKGF